jgi:hypothetical protein
MPNWHALKVRKGSDYYGHHPFSTRLVIAALKPICPAMSSPEAEQLEFHFGATHVLER